MRGLQADYQTTKWGQFATDRKTHTKLRLGCRHSFGHEQLPVISYFSHHTSMRDQQVLYDKTAELSGLQNTIDFFRSLESASPHAAATTFSRALATGRGYPVRTKPVLGTRYRSEAKELSTVLRRAPIVPRAAGLGRPVVSVSCLWPTLASGRFQIGRIRCPG
jgi:hypothetical protein